MIRTQPQHRLNAEYASWFESNKPLCSMLQLSEYFSMFCAWIWIFNGLHYQLTLSCLLNLWISLIFYPNKKLPVLLFGSWWDFIITMNHGEKNLSYLQARDPSIITWNFSAAKVVKKNLQDVFENTETTFEEVIIIHLKAVSHFDYYVLFKFWVSSATILFYQKKVIIIFLCLNTFQ